MYSRNGCLDPEHIVDQQVFIRVDRTSEPLKTKKNGVGIYSDLSYHLF